MNVRLAKRGTPSRRVDHHIHRRRNQGLRMLFYRAAVDLSHQTLNYVAGMIQRRRKVIGSIWRLLNRGQQALLVLDGTLIHAGRVKAARPYFSGKHRMHGMNVQVIASPNGTILWTSGALPDKAHDLSAARIRGILRVLRRPGSSPWPDKAYQGTEGLVITRTRAKGNTSPSPRSRPTAPSPRSADPANAQLKSWKILRKQAAAHPRPATSARPSLSLRTTVSHRPPEMKEVNDSACKGRIWRTRHNIA
ncbi:transposase family protein [Nonomuraea sp. NPDC050227]|uniref:transposase family protein n=1 Tax=Nonomuraea sp. NPDC050227 TaxID=3364360 RepID=UPI0037B37F2E